MHELMKVGMALYRNGIPFGPYDDCVSSRDAGWVRFVSNGITHRVGFIHAYRIDGRRPRYMEYLPIGFGIKGGGCCGGDLLFNENGELEWLNKPFGKPAGVTVRPWNNQDTRHLEKFVAGFDQFERDFYSYVDNL